MALINDIYVFVESEKVDRSIDIVKHPIEKGIDITDHITKKPITISISGRIVGEDSWNTQSKLIAMLQKGTIISYAGRNTLNNAQITKFNTSHPNTIWGGCSFDAEIKEVKIAQNSYKEITKEVTKAGTQQKESNSTDNKVYHTIKKGDTLWTLLSADNAPYKSYGQTVTWVLENNPEAFSIKGDPKTLKIGAKLCIGERK